MTAETLSMSQAIVAIVGRPNVGKSSLFNRLLRRRISVTSKISGTTRDSLSSYLNYRDKGFLLVDTAGIEFNLNDKTDIEISAQEQVKIALLHADLILFLVDVQESLCANDYKIAQMLHKSSTNSIVVAHKADNPRLMDEKMDFYELGLGEPIAVSSIQNIGTETLLDSIYDKLPESDIYEEESVNIALIGRPNVGKSSIINSITGENHSIVSDIAGTTRDSKDISFKYRDESIKFIDTAGLRRRGKIKPGIEKFSALRTMSSINRSDVAILVTDVSEDISKQDLHIAGMCKEAGCGLIIVANKWDLVPDKDEYTMNSYIKKYQYAFDFLPYAPLVFTSAETGQRLKNILDLSLDIVEERKKRISSSDLNNFLKEAIYKQIPAARKNSLGDPKLMYINQLNSKTPTFNIVAKRSDNVHFSYVRYLENMLRKKYGFHGTAIRLNFAESKSK